MLSLTPKVCLPDRQLATSLKMFQSELQRQDIQLGFSVDLSFVEFDVSWVMVSLPILLHHLQYKAHGQGRIYNCDYP
jgi:hypothetical protein